MKFLFKKIKKYWYIILLIYLIFMTCLLYDIYIRLNNMDIIIENLYKIGGN